MKVGSAMQAFRASLESAEEQLPVEGVLEGGENSLEAGILEVQEAAAPVAETETAIDELTEVAEGLEEIADAVEAAVEDGGLATGAAEMLTLATESYTRRLGLESAPVASLESFGGASNRLQATRVSLEGLRETVENIWNAIKQQITKWINALRDYYQRVWAAAPKLRKRAEELKAKIDGLDGKSPKEKKVAAGGIVKALHISGKFPADLGAEIKKFGALIDTMIKDGNKNNVKFAEDVATAAAGFDAEKGVATVTALMKDINAKFTKHGSGVGGKLTAVTGDDRFGKDQTVERTAEMPGGKAVFFTSRTSASADAKAFGADVIASSSVKVLPVAKKEPDLANAEMEVLDIAAMRAVCEAVVGVADSIESYKRAFEDADKAKSKLIEAGDKMAKTIKSAKELQGDDKAAANAVFKMLQALPRVITATGDVAVTQGLNVSKAALAAVEKSLGQYGKKED